MLNDPQSPSIPTNDSSESGVSVPVPTRNPVTHARHRHEVFWQITIPAIIGTVIILALAFLVGLQSFAGGDYSRWAAISLIWLIMPVMTVSLVFLVILGGMTYGLIQLIRVVPIYARQVQDFFELLRVQLSIIDNKIIEPILRAHASRAATQEFGRQIRKSTTRLYSNRQKN